MEETERCWEAHVFDIANISPYGVPLIFVLNYLGKPGFDTLLLFKPHPCGGDAFRRMQLEYCFHVSAAKRATLTTVYLGPNLEEWLGCATNGVRHGLRWDSRRRSLRGSSALVL